MKKTENTNPYEALFQDYPEFLSARDLIDLGIFRCAATVSRSKRLGWGPPAVNVGGRKFLYPKNRLIEWILSRECVVTSV